MLRLIRGHVTILYLTLDPIEKVELAWIYRWLRIRQTRDEIANSFYVLLSDAD